MHSKGKVCTEKQRTSSDVWFTTRSILCRRRWHSKGWHGEQERKPFSLNWDLVTGRGVHVHKLHATVVDAFEQLIPICQGAIPRIDVTIV